MRGFLNGILITLHVLAGLITGAALVFDGTLRDEVEGQVATSLQPAAGFESKPTVTIEGYPMAWHLIQRSFPSVRVEGDAMDVPLDQGGTARLSDVDLTFTDVTAEGEKVLAAAVGGGATMDYGTLGALARVDAQSAGGDLVKFTTAADVFGVKVPIAVRGRLAVDVPAQTVALVDSEADVAGVSVPTQVSQPVVAAMLQPVRVPLPYGLRLASMTPGPDSVGVTVTGTDVSFPLAGRGPR